MHLPTGDRAERNQWEIRRRWRARLGVVASIAVLLSGLFISSPAQASADVPCPYNLITEWRRIKTWLNGGLSSWHAYRFTTLSATPRFLVSDGRWLVNNTDQPVTYTIASSVSQTFTVSATTGITANVGTYLTTSVSSNIVSSRTTALGVTLSTTVQPHTTLIAEYGVDGFDVSYLVDAWSTVYPGTNPPPPSVQWGCTEMGTFPQNTIAPTHMEGWRLRSA